MVDVRNLPLASPGDLSVPKEVGPHFCMNRPSRKALSAPTRKVKRLTDCVRFGGMSWSDVSQLRGSESLSEQRNFDDFYRACREEMVRALVLAVGHRDLGVEAADEGFTRALEHWAEVSGFENPEGWVYRVGMNWARSHLRRRAFTVDGLFADAVHVDDLPNPELLEAVEQLPIRHRSVVVARFFLDWSIEQTSEALSIPEGTVKTRQHRALARLRRRLGEHHEF